MATTDEEIIRRKLLIEGDGGNDDKRIMSLLKTFVQWCNSNESSDESAYQRMLSTVAQCEFAVEKSSLVYAMNQEEQQKYDDLSTDIERQILEAHKTIALLKGELHRAKLIRKNKQEYDALAQVIQEHPDRQQTVKQLQSLEEELVQLSKSKESLERKFELRKKQFHVLITAIHEMHHILEEDGLGQDTMECSSDS